MKDSNKKSAVKKSKSVKSSSVKKSSPKKSIAKKSLVKKPVIKKSAAKKSSSKNPKIATKEARAKLLEKSKKIHDFFCKEGDAVLEFIENESKALINDMSDTEKKLLEETTGEIKKLFDKVKKSTKEVITKLEGKGEISEELLLDAEKKCRQAESAIATLQGKFLVKSSPFKTTSEWRNSTNSNDSKPKGKSKGRRSSMDDGR